MSPLRSISKSAWGWTVLAVLALLVPFVLNAYWVDVVNSMLLYLMAAIGLDLMVGHAGIYNFGQAAFYGLGAYTTAILATQAGVPILLTLPLSILVSGLLAALVTLPAIHLRGDYLLIVTVGLGEIFRIAMVNNPWGLTGGANGVLNVPHPQLFGLELRTPVQYYGLLLFFTVLVMIVSYLLVNSKLGHGWHYLRDDPEAATAMGLGVPRLKMLAVATGAAIAGLAGGLFAGKLTLVAPDSFTFWESSVLFAIVILGGAGSLPGTVVGALAMQVLPEFARSFAQYRMVIFGAAMVLMMIFRPQGIWPASPWRFHGRAGATGDGTPTESLAGSPPQSLAGSPRTALGRAGASAKVDAEGARAWPSPTSAAGTELTTAPLLEITELSKSFGGVQAVQNVSLSLPRGGILGLIGPNGAGKTTIFNLITGFYRPDSGSIRFDGRELAGLAADRIALLGIARTFQATRLFPNLTALDNVLSGRQRFRRLNAAAAVFAPWLERREEAREVGRARHYMRLMDLDRYEDELAHNLPYGEQRRLEIARALATEPTLLILDEPAAGLNEEESAQLLEQVRAIRASGVTILLIEHDMSVVMNVCDRVACLDQGRLIAYGTPAEVQADAGVIEAYLGRPDDLFEEGVEP